jgi:FkbM family methyltransferase
MNRLNILISGTMIGPGGIAHHTREFTKRLASNHNVKFRNFNIPDKWHGYSVDMYFNLKELDVVHNSILFEQTLWSNGELVNFPLSGYDSTFKPDVYLVMAEANHYYYYNFEKSDIPIVAYFPWESTKIEENFFKQLLKFTQVWVPSEWQKTMLINQGFPSEKIKIVNEGVDSDIFCPVEEVKTKKFTFLHIGKWEYRKSTYEICKAFIDEYGSNNDVELRLSINNKFTTQDSEIDTFKKFGLPVTDNIVFLGTMSEEQYISEIRNANVYLSCSRGEGWNLPLIQSMASGIPSVWSNIGGQFEFANGAELRCDIVREIPISEIRYINNQSWCWDVGYDAGNLYEPDFVKFSQYIRDVYTHYNFYKKRSLDFSNNIRQNFDWSVSTDLVEFLLDELVVSNKFSIETENHTNVYYLVHAKSFGDILASTPTLRYLSKSHSCKINVVTYNKSIFNKNPYVDNIYTFDEWASIKDNPHLIVYKSFTSPGEKDERGIEKKFGHIDIRQIHSMDLGFQLLPDDMYYDFYPDSMELSVNLPDEYVVLHITNNWPNRTWDYDKWRTLIQWLSDKKIFTVLIGMGHRETLHHSISNIPMEKICPSFDNLYGIDLANQGTMSDMWHIINGAKVFITMDSGPLHLAGTTDTHIIQLGSAIQPLLRAPYRHGRQDYKYTYIPGSCSLFCNSNLFYNVREWGDINSIPPQIGCLENYSEFKCHSTVGNVIDEINNIYRSEISMGNGIINSILTDVAWDGGVFRYNFSKNIQCEADIVLRDFKTEFKAFSANHTEINPIDGYYWVAIDPDKIIKRDMIVELHINGKVVESHLIERDGAEDFLIDGISINSDLFEFPSKYEDYFMTFSEVFFSKLYDKHSVSVEKNDVVVDIGANHGFFTLFALYKGASEIISVEPMSSCYNNLKRISTKFKKIYPINAAVTDKNGIVEFNVNENASAGSYVTGVNYVPFMNDMVKLEVASIDINTLISNINKHIDLLKIDCEGAEELIIDSIDVSILNNIPKLIIEAHTTDIMLKIKEKLETNGYVVNVDSINSSIYMMYCLK